MTLADLQRGERARVVSLDPANPNAAHLATLGLVPGREVTMLRRAPLGDPLHISLMQHEMCLRTIDARSVIVES